MMNLASLTSQLRSQVDENPRLRWGLVAIVLLVVFYGLTGLADFRRAVSSDYAQDLQRLKRIEHIAAEHGWKQRAYDAKQMLAQLRAEVPESDSVGLAQATFQGWLRSAAIATNPKLNIHIGTPQQVADGSKYWQIPAQVAGAMSVGKSLELLRKIESSKELVIIRRVQISAVRPTSLSLDVVAFYRIDAKSGGS